MLDFGVAGEGEFIGFDNYRIDGAPFKNGSIILIRICWHIKRLSGCVFWIWRNRNCRAYSRRSS